MALTIRTLYRQSDVLVSIEARDALKSCMFLRERISDGYNSEEENVCLALLLYETRHVY